MNHSIREDMMLNECQSDLCFFVGAKVSSFELFICDYFTTYVFCCGMSMLVPKDDGQEVMISAFQLKSLALE